MGVLADFLANSTTIDTSLPRVGTDRATVRRINDFMNRLGDPEYPSGMSAVNEVQNIAIHVGTVSGGTFTLTFTLHGGVTFTTGAIAHSAVAATIQTAINVAAAPVVPGWTNGDIVITGGPLTTTPLVITYSGNSVKQKNHSPVTGDGASLTGGGTLGAITTSAIGQPTRTAYSALIVMGILSAPAPAHGATATIVVQNARGSFPHNLDEQTVRDIVHQVGVEESNQGLTDAILAALGY